MKAKIERYERTAIVKITGKIEIGNGDVQLRESLEGAIQPGISSIILDLSKVSYMDSSGIGDLVRSHNALREHGIKLCLTNLNPKVYSLMVLTQLVAVFPIYDSTIDAIMSLYKAA